MLASFRDLTDSISLHHNLFASSRDRHPTLAGSPRTKPDAIVDFRNNVIYNLSGATNLGNCRINVINNYYRPGPDTPEDRQPLATKTENSEALKVYMTGNLFEGREAFTTDNWLAIDFDRWSKGGYRPMSLQQIRVDAGFDVRADEPQTDSATDAMNRVLQSAGASHPRDAADQRLVEGVRMQTNRLIDSQTQVGGWPELSSTRAPADSDGDGMPDEWETSNGLDAKDSSDGNKDRDVDGFTNLEEYLNSIVGLLDK